MTIKAIETQYNGYRFRSRLEARWAVFFDAWGVGYEYEPEGYDLGELGWYLPDFRLVGTFDDALVEIKPPVRDQINSTDGFLLKACLATKLPFLFAWGPPGDSALLKSSGAILYEYNPSFRRHVKITWIYWNDFPGAAEAAVIARSARFEYGETPKVSSTPPSSMRFWPSRDLEACPRCGSTPVMCSNPNSATFDQFVMCRNCKFEGPHDDSFGGAKTLWNQQATIAK